MAEAEQRITGRAFWIGTLLSAVFAYLAVYLQGRRSLTVSATQLAVLPMVAVLLTVLLVNPALRLLRRVRPFSRAETLLIFVMGMVSSGLAVFGLAGQLVPLMGDLYNPYWNTPQSGWNRYVVPYLDDRFFVSEPGVTAAARRYREACDRRDDTRALYDTADQAARHQPGAEIRWRTAAAAAGLDRGSREAADHLAPLAGRLKQDEAEVGSRSAALDAIEARGAEKIRLFRRGLPSGLRAFPGFIPAADDTWTSYVNRARRAWLGAQAQRRLKQAEAAAGAPARLLPPLSAAIGCLQPLGGTPHGWPTVPAAAAAEERRRLQNRLQQDEQTLEHLRAEVRFAPLAVRSARERDIGKLARDVTGLRPRLRRVEARWQALMLEVELADAFMRLRGELERLRNRLSAGPPVPPAEVRAILAGVGSQLAPNDATLRGFLAGHVPWRVWLRPIAWWTVVVGLTYLVMLSLNVLIFRQWATHEKLSYPLAQIAEDAGGVGAADGDTRLPAVFRSGLFWAGFASSGGVLGWNILCASKVVAGLEPLKLDYDWSAFIVNTPLQGLIPQARACVFFTVIGLSFLVPQQISFSLWFFRVAAMVLMLAMIAAGRGVGAESFPADWWYTLNYETALGGGALLVFSVAVLIKCRDYLLCVFRPAALGPLASDERRELRWASACFLAGLAALVLVQVVTGANLGYALFFMLMLLVVTIGLTRAVAEGGLLSFQAYFTPLHLVRALGMNKALAAPPLFVALVPYLSVMFQDLKTFIAPAMANGLKIRADLRLERFRFHAAVAAGIFVAAAVAVGAHITLAYHFGADNLNRWFNTDLPKQVFGEIGNLVRAPPAATPERGWLVLGALLMGLLLHMRRSIFWMPHPIGMMMLINPLMRNYWFSILLGWAAKGLVTTYGNKDAHQRVRRFFVGLIVGELLMVVVAAILSLAMETRIPVELNRVAP